MTSSLLLALSSSCISFTLPPPTPRSAVRMCAAGGSSLDASVVEYETIREMGCRDWEPLFVSRGQEKSEKMPDGALRFIQEGRGSVKTSDGQVYEVTPDMLVTVKSPNGEWVDFTWTCDDACEELLVLVPEYYTLPRILARNAAPLVVPAVAIITVANIAIGVITDS